MRKSLSNFLIVGMICVPYLNNQTLCKFDNGTFEIHKNVKMEAKHGFWHYFGIGAITGTTSILAYKVMPKSSAICHGRVKAYDPTANCAAR